MKPGMMLLFVLTILLFPAQNSGAFPEAPAAGQPHVQAGTENSTDLVSPEEKEQLHRDAKELSDNFRALVKDFSTVSSRVVKSMVDYIADWIETNYNSLSERKKEILENFISTTQRKYREVKEMSLETLQSMLQDFLDLLDKLEQEEPEGEKTTQDRIHI